MSLASKNSKLSPDIQWLLFALASITLLTMNFYDHRISFLPTESFLENEYPSEQFVIFRIMHNTYKDNSQRDHGGLMLNYDHSGNQIFDRNDKDAFHEKTLEVRARIDGGAGAQIYMSHAALQLSILNPIWQGLMNVKEMVIDRAKEGSRTIDRMNKYDTYYIYHISQLAMAVLSALCLTSILVWVYRTFSPATAWITLFGVLIFMLPLTYFGRNLWWMMWSWFLPLIIVLWGYAWSKTNSPSLIALIIIGALAGFATFIKVSMGYEYSSTVMMASLIPIFFYASLRGELKIIPLIIPLLTIGTLVFLGFVAALYYHYKVLNDAGHDGLEIIKNRFFMRAYNAEKAGHSGDLLKSTQSSIFTVIMKYIFEPQKIALPQLLYLIPPGYWYYRFYFKGARNKIEQHAQRLYDGLAISIAIGFMGAISMYIILKGHAYIHGFDVVAWYIPMNIFIIIWASFTFVRILSNKLSKNS